MKSYRISAPYLTDEERREAATGYTGPAANTDQLLGKITRERKVKVDPILVALQGKHIYAGTVDPAVVADRRRKNKAARRSRRINRLAAHR